MAKLTRGKIEETVPETTARRMLTEVELAAAYAEVANIRWDAEANEFVTRKAKGHVGTYDDLMTVCNEKFGLGRDLEPGTEEYRKLRMLLYTKTNKLRKRVAEARKVELPALTGGKRGRKFDPDALMDAFGG